MTYFSIIWVIVLSLFSPLGNTEPLSTKIDALIEKQLPYASVGVVVTNAKTGQVVYSRNANKLFSPASAMKLFTAAASLYQLSPSYQFSTSLSQKGQDYFLTFQGAPDFTIANLNTLLSNLRQSVLKNKTIQGNIILDESLFKAPFYSSGVSYDDLGWYYAAPETALILNENAVAYDFISAKKLGLPIQIKAKTSEAAEAAMAQAPLTIINQVVSVSKEQEKNHCALHIEIQPNNTLRLFGCLAKADGAITMQLAVPDPILLAKQVIQESLKKNNLVLKGKILIGKTPKDAKPIASIQSAQLSELVTHMLKESDNLYANSIARTLGHSVTGEGSNKQGAFALRKILSEHTHLNMAELEIADGIGTRYNLASPQQIVALLTDLYRDKTLQPILLKALPQSAVSGSLKDRMKQGHLNGIVFAKTGTMHDISSLSGYLLKPNADPLIFSIVINGVNAPIGTAKGLEEQILEQFIG